MDVGGREGLGRDGARQRTRGRGGGQSGSLAWSQAALLSRPKIGVRAVEGVQTARMPHHQGGQTHGQVPLVQTMAPPPAAPDGSLPQRPALRAWRVAVLQHAVDGARHSAELSRTSRAAKGGLLAGGGGQGQVRDPAPATPDGWGREGGEGAKEAVTGLAGVWYGAFWKRRGMDAA